MPTSSLPMPVEYDQANSILLIALLLHSFFDVGRCQTRSPKTLILTGMLLGIFLHYHFPVTV